MANIIKITESANRLEFTGTYTPIVCGNSNYYLQFVFDDIWKNCNRKTAVFTVEDKRAYVDFEGNEVKVPVLPNAPCVHVSLITGEGDEQMSTTPLKIRLEPSALGGNLSEFNQLASYLPKVHAIINDLHSGEISVKQAKVAENVCNPNLLINGNFQVNQRGSSSYSRTSGYVYTVDRWVLWSANGTFNVASKIVANNATSGNAIFSQFIENSKELLGKTLTFSVKVNDTVYSATGTMPTSITENKVVALTEFATGYIRIQSDYSRGLVRVDIGTSVGCANTIHYAKLEVGEVVTNFSPRIYAEELAMCQRFYQIISTSVKYGTFANGGCAMKVVENDVTLYSFTFNLPLVMPMRVNPSVSLKSTLTILCKGAYSTGITLDSANLSLGYTTNFKTMIIKKDLSFDANGLFATLRSDDSNLNAPTELYLDAEIY